MSIQNTTNYCAGCATCTSLKQEREKTEALFSVLPPSLKALDVSEPGLSMPRLSITGQALASLPALPHPSSDSVFAQRLVAEMSPSNCQTCHHFECPKTNKDDPVIKKAIEADTKARREFTIACVLCVICPVAIGVGRMFGY